MATHSSILAWRIPGMVEPGGLPSMGLHRVGHDRSDLAAAAAQWQQRSGIIWRGLVLLLMLTAVTYNLQKLSGSTHKKDFSQGRVHMGQHGSSYHTVFCDPGVTCLALQLPWYHSTDRENERRMEVTPTFISPHILLTTQQLAIPFKNNFFLIEV